VQKRLGWADLQVVGSFQGFMCKRATHIKGWVDFWILQGVMCKSTANEAVQLRWRRVARPYWLGSPRGAEAAVHRTVDLWYALI
jgi:hypothetical protein